MTLRVDPLRRCTVGHSDASRCGTDRIEVRAREHINCIGLHSRCMERDYPAKFMSIRHTQTRTVTHTCTQGQPRRPRRPSHGPPLSTRTSPPRRRGGRKWRPQPPERPGRGCNWQSRGSSSTRGRCGSSTNVVDALHARRHAPTSTHRSLRRRGTRGAGSFAPTFVPVPGQHVGTASSELGGQQAPRSSDSLHVRVQGCVRERLMLQVRDAGAPEACGDCATASGMSQPLVVMDPPARRVPARATLHPATQTGVTIRRRGSLR